MYYIICINNFLLKYLSLIIIYFIIFIYSFDKSIQIYPKNPLINQQFAIYGLTNNTEYFISLWQKFNNLNKKKLKFHSKICQFKNLIKNNTKSYNNWFIVPCECVPLKNHLKANYFYLIQIKNLNKTFTEIFNYSILKQSYFNETNKILSINYNKTNIINNFNLFHSFYIQLNLIEINKFNLKKCFKNKTIEQNNYEIELRYRPFEMLNSSMFISNNITNLLFIDYLYDIQENNNNLIKKNFSFGKLITKKQINFLNNKNFTQFEFECWHFTKPGYYKIILNNNSNIKILVNFFFKYF